MDNKTLFIHLSMPSRSIIFCSYCISSRAGWEINRVKVCSSVLPWGAKGFPTLGVFPRSNAARTATASFLFSPLSPGPSFFLVAVPVHLFGTGNPFVGNACAFGIAQDHRRRGPVAATLHAIDRRV